MKKNIIFILLCILSLFFVVMPFPASGLTIRLYFKEMEGDAMMMYYTTVENPDFSNSQTITAPVNKENRLVAFRLPPETVDQLTLIRFDFPEEAQLLSINNISVSSGGIIRHNYDPCEFFSESNIFYKNEILSLDLVPSRRLAYIETDASDPYLILDTGLLSDILQYRSHYRLSRLVACLLVICGYVLYQWNPFAVKSKTGSRG